jgi:hypothetical protein
MKTPPTPKKTIYECHILSQEMYKNVVQYKIPVCVEAPNNPVEPNPVVCPRLIEKRFKKKENIDSIIN